MRIRFLTAAAYALVAAGLLTSCGDGTGPDSSPVARIAVTAASPSIQIGQQTQVTVTLQDASGRTLTGRSITYTSSNPSVATVTATGSVTALAVGQTAIIATSEGLSGAVTITVAPQPVATIAVAGNSSVEVGQTTQLTATLKNASGGVISDQKPTWTSSSTAIASVDANGIVTGFNPGQATITATAGTASGSLAVTVVPQRVASVTIVPATASAFVGQTTQLLVVLTDASGNVIGGRDVVWTSSNARIATVNAAGGVTGLDTGTVKITATADTKSATATITFTRAPVGSVSILPSAATVDQGTTVTLQAIVSDALGNRLTGRDVTWQSGNPTIATVSATGTVTGVLPGTATIYAVSEGKIATALVTVTEVPLTAITVTPSLSTILVGETEQLTATPKDPNGNPVTGRTITWASTNTGVAIVTSTGFVQAVGPGTVGITATSGNIVGSASVTVNPQPVARVSVTPGSAGLFPGGTQQFQVTLQDQFGNPLNGRTVTWSSSRTSVASINANTGLATAIDTGSTTITATSEGRTGTATLIVSPLPAASIEITPTSWNTIVGASQTFRITLRDSKGGVITGRPVVWTSGDQTVATVDSTGLVRAVGVGSTYIRGRSEGLEAFASVSVTQAPVNSVTVTPASATIAVGTTAQFTATTRDVFGNTLTGRAVSWTTSNPAVATVDSNGLVTAQGSGTVSLFATSEGKTGTATVTVP